MQALEISNVNNLVQPDSQSFKPEEKGSEDSSCSNKEKFNDVLEKLKGMTDSNS